MDDQQEGPCAEQQGRRLVVLGLAAAALLVVTYLLMVLTPLGQDLGDQAYLGRLVEDARARADVGRMLGGIGRGTLLVMVLVVLAVGGLRRRWDVGLTAVGAFAAAVVGAEVLKRVLPREVLSPLEEQLKFDGANSFPSGHATIATSFVLALVLVSAVRWRPWVALVGVAWVSLLSVGTLAAGWHRPSDAVGGIALATGCFGVTAGVLVGRRYVVVAPPRASRLLLTGALVLGMLAAGIVMASSLGRSATGAAATVSPLAFPVACLVIATAATGAVVAFAWLLRRVQHPGHAAQRRPSLRLS